MEIPVPESPAIGARKAKEMADLVDEQRLASLNNLRKTGTGTDVIIECGDGILHAHKCILTSKNQYFEAMFQSHMLESQTNKINFSQSSAAIEVILAFVYAESQPASLLDDPKLLLEVIETSHMLQITKLFKFYWNTWSEAINARNLYEIWNLAIKFEENGTIARILDFLSDHFGLISREAVQKLTEPQIISFFKHTEDRPPTDGFVDLLLRWGAGDLTQRRHIVIKLVSSVDLNALTWAFVGALLEDNVLDDYPADFKDRFVKQAVVKLSCSPDLITHLMIDDFTGEVKMHFHLAQPYSTMVEYDLSSNSWKRSLNSKLKHRHCTNWQPIMSAKGCLFYYGMSKNQKFVVFDSVADKHHFGPRSNNLVAAGFIDGNEIYFREKNFFFAVFNFVDKKWKKLRFSMKACGQVVLVKNGKIYFDSNSVKSNKMRIYNVAAETWEDVVKPATEMVNVRCKCLSRRCKGKLYFIKEDSLFVWSERRGSWCEKVLPLVGGLVAVVANCDLNLIVFKEMDGSGSWLFFVLSNWWFKMPSSILGA